MLTGRQMMAALRQKADGPDRPQVAGMRPCNAI